MSKLNIMAVSLAIFLTPCGATSSVDDRQNGRDTAAVSAPAEPVTAQTSTGSKRKASRRPISTVPLRGSAKEETALGRALSMFAIDADMERYQNDTGISWGPIETAEGNDNAYRWSAKVRLLGFGAADLPSGAGADLKMIKGNGGDSWLTLHGFEQGSIYSLYVQKPLVPEDETEGVDYGRMIADQLDDGIITPLAVDCAHSKEGDGNDTRQTAFYRIESDAGTIWMTGTVEESGKYSGGDIILDFTREEPMSQIDRMQCRKLAE